MNRYKKLIAFVAFSILVLSLPVIASAQWRGRGNNDRNQGNDDYYNRNRVNLSYAISNLKNTSKRFEDILDRELDRSRYDGTNREDNLNRLAERFKDAAKDLDDEYDNRGNLRNSSDEARRLLDAGSQLDRALTRSRVGRNSTISNNWDGIEKDLITIAQAYNYDYRGTYGRNGRYGDDDDRYGNNGRNNRNLRATIVNLRNKAKNFERRVDREYDDRRSNRRRNSNDLQDLAGQFKRAVEQLEDEYGNRRDYNRSADEARDVLNLGQQLDRAVSRARVSSSIESDWNRIEDDLRDLADAYNYSYNDRNNRNDRNGRWGNFPLPFPF